LRSGAQKLTRKAVKFQQRYVKFHTAFYKSR
jgi:hypothetical protein